jgi:ankyrin repeat protein
LEKKASQNGFVEIVRYLIGLGAKVNNCRTDTGWTPLFIAIQEGHFGIVECLLLNGAKIESPVKLNTNAMYIAVQNGREDIASLLLDYGAKVAYRGANDWTLAHVSAQNGHLDILKLLVEKGLNLDATNSNNATPLYIGKKFAFPKCSVLWALLLICFVYVFETSCTKRPLSCRQVFP